VIWHSDKPVYQKECSEKIASVMSLFSSPAHKQEWFENFIYIFNSHWDKVDNFRIDKYLMFLRFMMAQAMKFLQQEHYKEPLLKWYKETIFNIFKGQLSAQSACGVSL